MWTTFNEHQWDLNWANPQVFLEMAGIMLFLANKGVDVLRFDAVAFMWKRMGTRCQSEPEVHMLLHALRAVSRIAAPAAIHLEEAIVSPAEMIPYLGLGEHNGREGNLAYHNSLMVQFWSALAARDARLMTHVLKTHFPPELDNATYATYIRCHDDIGWAVTDEDARAVGFDGFLHRAFLSDFYEGGFPGSFSRGAVFQFNPATGDKRISGTTASLAGLERAEADGDQNAIDRAIDRILLGHALIASFGGIPLIYMGDEIALLERHQLSRRAGARRRQPLDPPAAHGLGTGGRSHVRRQPDAGGAGLARRQAHPRTAAGHGGVPRRQSDGDRRNRRGQSLRLRAQGADQCGRVHLQFQGILGRRSAPTGRWRRGQRSSSTGCRASRSASTTAASCCRPMRGCGCAERRASLRQSAAIASATISKERSRAAWSWTWPATMISSAAVSSTNFLRPSRTVSGDPTTA